MSDIAMHDPVHASRPITDSRRVLAIPLHDGGWLLTSPERPRQLLQDLQQLAGTRRTP
ncbi:hypothetical protein [[Pseudomonas] boreopolis]|uniref:hypothetical protein n=1 Tax=Xanthomonas boreopolis TaxID=86183 RepID=UPI003DA096BF